ncbi:MAG: hypothetical protein COB96_07025 [Planctomycetota bacterium]|nr:MAG: hypothetical protein COB96_07025 [Planctomycetota bacterium]
MLINFGPQHPACHGTLRLVMTLDGEKVNSETLNHRHALALDPIHVGVEQELGFAYSDIDALLHLQVDRRYPRKQLLEVGFNPELIDTLSKRVRENQYKRRPPVIAKLANRTINLDYRYARDWGA